MNSNSSFMRPGRRRRAGDCAPRTRRRSLPWASPRDRSRRHVGDKVQEELVQPGSSDSSRQGPGRRAVRRPRARAVMPGQSLAAKAAMSSAGLSSCQVATAICRLSQIESRPARGLSRDPLLSRRRTCSQHRPGYPGGTADATVLSESVLRIVRTTRSAGRRPGRDRRRPTKGEMLVTWTPAGSLGADVQLRRCGCWCGRPRAGAALSAPVASAPTRRMADPPR